MSRIIKTPGPRANAHDWELLAIFTSINKDHYTRWKGHVVGDNATIWKCCKCGVEASSAKKPGKYKRFYCPPSMNRLMCDEFVTRTVMES